jgi:hypothetical protein
MISLYLLCFTLLVAGTFLILELTPETVTDDIMRMVVPEQTLRDKVLIAQKKKKSRKITKALLHMREALTATGKSNQFTVTCAASLMLMIAGCIAAVMINNFFMIPVFALAFASLPFLFARNTISAYDKHIREEMETALSVVTTSYIRTDDIVTSVKENLTNLKPPIRDIFAGFVGDAMMVSSDTKAALRNLRDRIDNDIFAEWCDTLIACQDDRTLNDTLLPIVSKLTDVRIVNNELKTMLDAVRNEYLTMVLLVVGNIPLIYALNKDWFSSLMFTTPGKIVLAVCGMTILITAMFMLKFTKPIEYKR